MALFHAPRATTCITLLALLTTTSLAAILSSTADLDVLEREQIPCVKPEAKCPEGRVCAGGRPDNKRCVKPMPVGAFCARDPFWVCEKGLICVNEICRRRVAQKGESCVPPGTKCVSGTICAGGRPDNKRCVKPMPVGGFCKRDPFWVCDKGLICVNEICRRRVAQKGESCVPPGTRCVSGTVCAGGRPDNQRCVKPMPVGGFCKRDPFWVCDRGLICVNEICERPVSQRGWQCSLPGSKCANGLVCSGEKPENRKCVKPIPEGGFCDERPQSVCDKGLTCIKKMCLRM